MVGIETFKDLFYFFPGTIYKIPVLGIGKSMKLLYKLRGLSAGLMWKYKNKLKILKAIIFLQDLLVKIESISFESLQVITKKCNDAYFIMEGYCGICFR